MSLTTVHNLRHERMLPGDVLIDRRTEHGNRFILGRDGDRDQVCDLYDHDLAFRLATDRTYYERVRVLHGKRLFCWCHPERCHGHSLAAASDLIAEGVL